MDRAYEGDETRQLVFDLGMEPVVPPKRNRLSPWEYDKEMYKKRNEVERLSKLGVDRTWFTVLTETPDTRRHPIFFHNLDRSRPRPERCRTTGSARCVPCC